MAMVREKMADVLDRVDSAGRSEPEVVEKPRRRRFSAAYKARIVQETEACTECGQVGALLRREGLYSSNIEHDSAFLVGPRFLFDRTI